MKFIAISDTHGFHRKLTLPNADVLIHAGDISMKGTEDQVIDFLNWFKELDFEYKIFIAGNHDFYFERTPHEEIKKIIPENIIYLNNSGIKINNIKIWGSPITPYFFNWAFNRHRGQEINRYWELIPDDTQLLITHGPIFRTLDKTIKNENVGCKDLFKKVHEIKPLVHICGHIHEAYGEEEKNNIKFINASVLNEKYEHVNKPISFTYNDHIQL